MSLSSRPSHLPLRRPVAMHHGSLNGLRLLVVGLVLGGSLALTPTQAAAWTWEGSPAEDVVAKTVDALVIRPMATVRAAIGAAMMVPAALFSLPSGREGVEGAYEILIEAPVEFAFRRPLGEF